MVKQQEEIIELYKMFDGVCWKFDGSKWEKAEHLCIMPSVVIFDEGNYEEVA